MNSFKESVGFWATVLGTLVGIFGVLQSYAWIALAGALIVTLSIAVAAYAEAQRSRMKSASVTIGGRSFDSLNIASLRRRLNRSLAIQRVQNVAVIDGDNLSVFWKCSGYCIAGRETALECSIDADTNIPFDQLECYAFDLRRDPRRQHRIHPILVGADGISKKIAIPFLAPLAAREPFSVILRYALPGSMKPGADYYTATLSFEQETIPQYSARLRFLRGHPRWVRLYECRADGDPKLLKDLRPQQAEAGVREYLDNARDVPARTARVYVFERPAYAESREGSETGLAA